MALTMLYSLLLTPRNNPESMSDPEWRAAAMDVVNQCKKVVGTFCRGENNTREHRLTPGWPYSRGLVRAFEALADRIASSIVGEPPNQPVDTTASAVQRLSLAGPPSMPQPVDLFPRQNDMQADTWLNGSISHLDVTQPPPQSLNNVPAQSTEMTDAAVLENFMSSMGWLPEWPTDMDIMNAVVPEQQ